MGIEDKLIQNWANNEQKTFGQRFVEKFPSQAKDDPELKMKQERNVQWLIDTLVPQSKSDVAMTAGSMFAGGPVGRVFGKAAKPALSKYYASILGSGKVKIRDLEAYMMRLLYNPKKLPANRKVMEDIVESSPSMQKIDINWRSESYITPEHYVNPDDVAFRGITKGFKDQPAATKVSGYDDTSAFRAAVGGLIKEAKDAYKYYYGK